MGYETYVGDKGSDPWLMAELGAVFAEDDDENYNAYVRLIVSSERVSVYFLVELIL